MVIKYINLCKLLKLISRLKIYYIFLINSRIMIFRFSLLQFVRYNHNIEWEAHDFNEDTGYRSIKEGKNGIVIFDFMILMFSERS